MDTKFEIIVNRISPTLRRITHRLNGHFSFFDEDDLYQEALEHLWVDFNKDTLSDKTDSYVLQGCYFYLKNYIRTNLDKAKLFSLDDDKKDNNIKLEDAVLYEDFRGIDETDEAFLLEFVRQRGLTTNEEKVLLLYMEGDTIREIAEKLGVSHVMVLKIRNKIRDKSTGLKDALKLGYQN